MIRVYKRSRNQKSQEIEEPEESGSRSYHPISYTLYKSWPLWLPSLNLTHSTGTSFVSATPQLNVYLWQIYKQVNSFPGPFFQNFLKILLTRRSEVVLEHIHFPFHGRRSKIEVESFHFEKKNLPKPIVTWPIFRVITGKICWILISQ